MSKTRSKASKENAIQSDFPKNVVTRNTLSRNSRNSVYKATPELASQERGRGKSTKTKTNSAEERTTGNTTIRSKKAKVKSASEDEEKVTPDRIKPRTNLEELTEEEKLSKHATNRNVECTEQTCEEDEENVTPDRIKQSRTNLEEPTEKEKLSKNDTNRNVKCTEQKYEEDEEDVPADRRKEPTIKSTSTEIKKPSTNNTCKEHSDEHSSGKEEIPRKVRANRNKLSTERKRTSEDKNNITAGQRKTARNSLKKPSERIRSAELEKQQKRLTHKSKKSTGYKSEEEGELTTDREKLPKSNVKYEYRKTEQTYTKTKACILLSTPELGSVSREQCKTDLNKSANKCSKTVVHKDGKEVYSKHSTAENDALENKNNASAMYSNPQLSESSGDESRVVKLSNNTSENQKTTAVISECEQVQGSSVPSTSKRNRRRAAAVKYTFDDSDESEEESSSRKRSRTVFKKSKAKYDIEIDEDEDSDFTPTKKQLSEIDEDEESETDDEESPKNLTLVTNKTNSRREYKLNRSFDDHERPSLSSLQKTAKCNTSSKQSAIVFKENQAVGYQEALKIARENRKGQFNEAMKYFFGKDFNRMETADKLAKATVSSEDTCSSVVSESNNDGKTGKEGTLEENTGKSCNNSSSSESEWEEVSDADPSRSIDDYNPEIPKEGIEINISLSNPRKDRRNKRKTEFANYARQYLNRFKKDTQIAMHKVHLLAYIAHMLQLNQLLFTDLLRGFILSILPKEFLGVSTKKTTMTLLTKLIIWFRNTFTFEHKETSLRLLDRLTESVETKEVTCPETYCYLFVIVGRTMKLDVRVCKSIYPIPFKTSDLIKTDRQKLKEGGSRSQTPNNELKPDAKCKKSPSLEKASTSKAVNVEKHEASKTKAKRKNKSKSDESKSDVTKRRSRGRKNVSYTENKNENSDVSDDKDFEPKKMSESSDEEDFKVTKPKRTKLLVKKSPKNKKNQKLLSSDSQNEPEPANGLSGIDTWAEVYLNNENKWVSVDVIGNIVNRPYVIESNASQQVCYVLSVDNDSKVKDVTQRYASGWLTETRKLRIGDWWEESLEPFGPPKVKREKAEDELLDAMLYEKPMPSKISDFKNHPLYALKRHLLKYEGIYPSDAPPLGYMRKEPVYARECVRTLHSREAWKRMGISVKPGEDPYKLVKARPRWDKVHKRIYTPEEPMDVYGEWQTEPYVAPPCKDGKVPRNEYGNVELFTESMLPKGAVHLRLPGLNRIARKLGIDCAQAMVGFDGAAHVGVMPVFDGFVVCKEYKDTMIAAWDEEQVNIANREKEKRDKRIYGNWRKLIRGLLIREKIKCKYLSRDEPSSSKISPDG